MKNSRVKRVHKVRLKLLTLLVMMAFTVLTGRLFSIQVLQHDGFLEAANRQQKLIVTIKADRGRIYDCKGGLLADSRDSYALFVEKYSGIQVNPEEMAKQLAPILECNRRTLASTIRKSKSRVRLDRKISRQKKEAIEALGLAGLSFELEKERFYPYNALASQVVGYAGIDYEGLAGIEEYCNSYLKGTDGTAVLQRDGLGRKRINPDFITIPPVAGKDVILTIDKHIQEIAESVLDDAMDRYGAKNGSIVIVDPKSGEIRGLACSPRIDLNSIPKMRNRKVLYEAMRNRVVTDVFEPGSTFKIVTLTSALERGLANLDEKIFCENGEYLVQNHRFHDVHEYGWLKVREVIELSSNIGAIKLAERVEKEGLYQTARKFGYGSRTGVNFPGEVEGVLNKLDQWSGLSLPSIAIGQEVSVTSLQMVMAYAAIANGGLLMKPIFVKEVRDSEGEIVFQAQPELIREVMTKDTAERVKEVLVGVVERGTGTKSRVKGFLMGGKTGTAQKTIPGKRGYAPGKYITTFGGFFPADTPKYAIFVTLDEPERDKWGGESAAPLCRDLIQTILFAANGILDETAPVQVADGPRTLQDEYRVLPIHTEITEVNEEKSEENRNPPEYILNFTRENEGEHTSLNYPFVPDKPARGKMPDVSGLSMREAIVVLSKKGIEIRTRGMGEVIKQEPAAGENITGKNLCILWGEDD